MSTALTDRTTTQVGVSDTRAGYLAATIAAADIIARTGSTGWISSLTVNCLGVSLSLGGDRDVAATAGLAEDLGLDGYTTYSEDGQGLGRRTVHEWHGAHNGIPVRITHTEFAERPLVPGQRTQR